MIVVDFNVIVFELLHQLAIHGNKLVVRLAISVDHWSNYAFKAPELQVSAVRSAMQRIPYAAIFSLESPRITRIPQKLLEGFVSTLRFRVTLPSLLRRARTRSDFAPVLATRNVGDFGNLRAYIVVAWSSSKCFYSQLEMSVYIYERTASIAEAVAHVFLRTHRNWNERNT